VDHAPISFRGFERAPFPVEFPQSDTTGALNLTRKRSRRCYGIIQNRNNLTGIKENEYLFCRVVS
jgi:hypothetical protein